MKTIILFLFSFQLSAQIPGWIIDSLIFETQQARACVRLDSSNQQTIFKQDQLIEAQAIQLSSQKDLIQEQSERIQLAIVHAGNQQAIFKTEKVILKARIRALWRWVVVEGVTILVVVVLLI